MSEPREGVAASEGLSRARLKQRFLTNSGLIVAARIVTACLSLATIPVLISRLGVAGYGTWEALLAFASLTTLFQTAIGGALVWRISEAYGKGDASSIRRAVRLGAGASWTTFVLLWPLAAFSVLFPLWFFRYARSLWVGFDQYFDPQVAESGTRQE